MTRDAEENSFRYLNVEELNSHYDILENSLIRSGKNTVMRIMNVGEKNFARRWKKMNMDEKPIKPIRV